MGSVIDVLAIDIGGFVGESVRARIFGAVGDIAASAESGTFGAGWTGFDFARAVDRPIRVVTDASLYALGSYDDGRMRFLGLGIGVASALVTEPVVIPLKPGNLPDQVRRSGNVPDCRGGLRLWEETVEPYDWPPPKVWRVVR
jgi:hypothetical protein